MRKHSGVIVLFREATNTYPVPNQSLVIEKGQKIIIPTYSICIVYIITSFCTQVN